MRRERSMIERGFVSMKYFGRTCLLLCLLLLPALFANAEETELKITPPEGREDALTYLTDGNVETRLTLESQKSLLVEWDCRDAASLMIGWYDVPSKVLVEVLDEEGKAVSRSLTEKPPFRQQVNVTAGSKVRLTSQSGYASLSELVLYRAGDKLPYSETKPYEADLLIVCAGATEECRLLGGLLPLYAAEYGMRTEIVYIRSDYGYVVGESFEALAELGFDDYPVFMRRDDQNVTQEERIRNKWRTTLTTDLWQIMRVVKPKIIVTLDPNDASQHARTRVAAKTVRDLVLSYSRKTDMPLQKFYVLSSEGTTVMDWRIPLTRFSGKTACEVAGNALEKYASQGLYGYTVPETSRFELVYTKVGPDTRGNDLLENVDTSSFISYAGPTPEPTPGPTPVPAVGALSGPEGPQGGAGTTVIALCCLAACLMPGLMKKKKAFAAAAAVLIVLLLPFGAGTVIADETVPGEIPAAAVGTAEEAGQTGTGAVPSPSDDNWYRQPDEPEEVIVSDYPNGHWEYRSDDLSVLIDREEFTLDGHPQCMYVAYIRSRNTDAFHCGLASTAESDQLIMPWRLARTYGAVLAITGDNLINAEKGAKGILIRNGVFYCDYQGEDTLAVYSSQKIGLVKRGEMTGLQLLDSGVRNAYSFGPILVENGEVNPDVMKHRVAKGNPRCGVGMIEEGCLVAIVADGRDPSRAYNLTLEEFAEIFKAKGAKLAYNLDGGNSAAMIFMGESVSCQSGAGGQRTWIDALLWGYSDQVPGVGDPIIHWGEGKGYYE